jgi:hypothetical protein
MLRSEAERHGYRSSFTIYDQADQVRLVKACLEELIAPRRERQLVALAHSPLGEYVLVERVEPRIEHAPTSSLTGDSKVMEPRRVSPNDTVRIAEIAGLAPGDLAECGSASQRTKNVFPPYSS